MTMQTAACQEGSSASRFHCPAAVPHPWWLPSSLFAVKFRACSSWRHLQGLKVYTCCIYQIKCRDLALNRKSSPTMANSTFAGVLKGRSTSACCICQDASAWPFSRLPYLKAHYYQPQYQPIHNEESDRISAAMLASQLPLIGLRSLRGAKPQCHCYCQGLYPEVYQSSLHREMLNFKRRSSAKRILRNQRLQCPTGGHCLDDWVAAPGGDCKRMPHSAAPGVIFHGASKQYIGQCTA